MAAVDSSADGFSARERKYVTEIIHRRTSPMCAIFLSPYHRRPKWILSILKQNSLRIQDWQNKGHYVDINLGGKSAGLPFSLPPLSVGLCANQTVRQTAAVLASWTNALHMETTFS